jgi:hypothetical protein
MMLDTHSRHIYDWATMVTREGAMFDLAQAYLEAYNGRLESVLRIAEKSPASIKYALIGAVQGDRLEIVRALIDRVDYGYLRVGLRQAISYATPPVIKMFAARVGSQTLGSSLITAIVHNNSDAAAICLEHGATNFTKALQSVRPWTRTHIVHTLLENGAIEWPACVYAAHLHNHPDVIIQLHKMGTPHYLLVNGLTHIQAVIDEHEAWNTHVKAELGSLGVYSVLTDLITQY